MSQPAGSGDRAIGEAPRTQVLEPSDSGGEVTRDDGVTRAAEPTTPPTRVGRYVVEARLGAGGMGEVFRGRDPELHRPVAIKLLRRRRSSASAEDQARLLREAQSLAALAHPNVVGVFEVGTHDGGIYIVMELVAGTTLHDWLRADEARSWRDTLDVFLQAGRGLAAAHAKGIVHRDFKPANVIVGDDGRARVLDFGLATPDRSSSSAGDPASDLDFDLASPSSDKITQAGVVMGTLAYMAPEQAAAAEVTTATDQFGFCAALWEALVGTRPFPAKTFEELVVRFDDGTRAPVPATVEVPRRVLAVLERGLAIEPRERWASMTQLLDALRRAAAPRRRRWIAAAGLTALAAAGVTLAVLWQPPAPCDPTDRDGLMPWTAARRDGLAERFEATPPGAAIWAEVVAKIDAHADAWSEAYANVCTGGVEAAGDQRTFDLRMGCLHQRADALRQMLVVLEGMDADSRALAPGTVATLGDVASCENAKQGDPATDLPDDPAVAARVTALRASLGRVEALTASGRMEEAVVDAEAVATEAAEVGFEPVVVEAEVQLGLLLSRLGRAEAAEQHLSAAFWSASEAGHDHAAAEAAAELAWLVGYLQGRHAEGVEWVRHFESVATRAGLNAPRTADALLGPIYFAWQRFDEARPHLERNLTRELERGADTAEAGIARMNFGVFLYESGELPAAAEQFELAQRTLEKLFPDGHPDLALTLINRASLVYELDEDAALSTELAQRGFDMSVAHNGMQHPSTALALSKLGQLRSHAGDHAAALEMLERARDLYEKSAHEERLAAEAEIAGALARAGRAEEAAAKWQYVLTEAQTRLGTEHPLVSEAHRQLGRIAADAGEIEAARRHFQHAIDDVAKGRALAAFAARLDLAQLQRDQGELDPSRATIDAAYDWANEALGPDNVHTQVARKLRAEIAAHSNAAGP